jgi:NADPH-dependent curcumin reductase CurA
MTIQNSQIIFSKDPGQGFPSTETFTLQKSDVSLDLQEQEVLLKNLYLSVDPYMRGRMNTKAKSYIDPFVIDQPLSGGGISQVVESRRDGLQKGDLVSGFIGWEEFTKVRKGQPLQKIDNPLNVPLEYFLGILGMPGATAYHGLLDIGEPKEGETVFVSGAAGAVGLIVGQIAKIKGCRVVGSAGSDEKFACKRVWI